MDNETYGVAYFNFSSTTIFPLFNDSDIFNIIDIGPCEIQGITTFYSSTGAYLAVPEWEAIFTAIILSFIIVSTIVGNILVILGVFTHKPLRIVQNFFIVSLAVADLAVAILVLPLNVTYSILGRWEWGIHLCKMWLTCDIMCCTSSILNLCAIALDRYWAITDPINYANKRTLRRVLFLIAGVWVLSLTISSPPLLGWNDWPDEFLPDTPCRLTSQQGYVIYSSLGSFFIPLLIMTIVYIKIFIATRRRLRERAKASQINMLTTRDSQCNVYADKDSQEVPDRESGNSESNPNENVSENGSECSNKSLGRTVKGKKCQKKEFMEIKNSFFMPVLMAKDSVSEIRTDSDSGIQETNNETVKYSPARYHKNVLSSLRSSKKHKHEKQLIAKTNRKGGVVHQFIEEKQKISLSKERRAARTLGIIMGVFVVCWLPFFLMYVILPFCPYCCPTDKLINFITWLGYINSALNPLIYTIFNMDFRKAFKKLLGISR